MDDNRPPVWNVAALAMRIHEASNAARRKAGLTELAWDEPLAAVATAHSGNMARRGFFAHESPEGETPSQRAERLGVVCRREVGMMIYIGVAENLFKTPPFGSHEYYRLPDGTESRTYHFKDEATVVRDAVEGWLNSPPHRENLLSPDLRRHGVGVAIAPDGTLLITDDFC